MDVIAVWQWSKVIRFSLSSAICTLFVWLLWNNLISKDHNWSYVRPNKHVIITSILVPLLFGLQAIQQLIACSIGIIGATSVCFPGTRHYYQIDVFSTFTYHLARFSYYLYLIFNLENHMNHNDIIRKSIPNKFVKIVKFFIFALFTEVIVLSITKYITQGGYHVMLMGKSVAYRFICLTIYIVGNLFLDLFILSFYVFALHVYATFWNEKMHEEYKKWKDTERSHELLKIVTRFVISFGYSVIFDIISVVVNVIFYYGFNKTHISWQLQKGIVVELAEMLNNFSFMLSVYFSHEFGHVMYEKICCIVDDKVNRCCVKMNRDRMENIGFSYQRVTFPSSSGHIDDEVL